jgi:hypothetical protein
LNRYLLIAYGLVCITLALRATILGEFFDRALHDADPAYRNQRDMLRSLVTNPRDGARELPGTFDRFANRLFRRIDDPAADQLRKRYLRGYASVALLIVPGFPIALFIFSQAERAAPSLPQAAALFIGVGAGVHWAGQLLARARDPERYPLNLVYALAGITAAMAATVATLLV